MNIVCGEKETAHLTARQAAGLRRADSGCRAGTRMV